jgi:hypothetical protein
MPNAKDRLVEDVQFILAECSRFWALQQEWFTTHHAPEELRDGFLWELPHPTDERAKIPCGRAGVGRVEDLARVAAQRAGIDRQVDILTVRTPLAKALVRRFILEKRPVNIQQVERSLSEACKRAKADLKTITHYIPCHLMLAERPEHFTIGPITFLRQRLFRRMLAASVRRAKSEHNKDRRFVGDVAKYYRTFGWVAVVTVPECDEKTSQRVAEESVTCALNCLHLIFGPQYTSRMVVGGPAIIGDSRGKFYYKEGKLSFEASYGGPGEVGFGDDWLHLLADPQAQHIFKLCGIALESASNPKLLRPLSQRFLDAAKWYGEAVRETSRAAKVVKYVTALERMLMTDEQDNIADSVSERIAAFCLDPFVTGDFERLKAQAHKAYSLRSKLVHGSMSQSDFRVYEGIKIGSDIGRNAILNSLMAMNGNGLTTSDARLREVARWFEGHVAYSKSIRDQFNGHGAYI